MDVSVWTIHSRVKLEKWCIQSKDSNYYQFASLESTGRNFESLSFPYLQTNETLKAYSVDKILNRLWHFSFLSFIV